MVDGRSRWAAARTLDEFGDLTAEWLEGTLGCHPCSAGDGPDPETHPIRALLVEANRAGFVTDWSQPGSELDDGWMQRAAVHGLCPDTTAQRIRAAVLHTEMVALVYPPGEWNDPTRIPVTVHNKEEVTWVGGPLPSPDIDVFYRWSGHDDRTALNNAWQVTLFDPLWERNDLLWEVLTNALRLGSMRAELVAVDYDEWLTMPPANTHDLLRRLGVKNEPRDVQQAAIDAWFADPDSIATPRLINHLTARGYDIPETEG